ncbi:MAG: hypothetical protein JWO21_1622 [Solirubrobacterales bacterium]|jgi:hypothetical protein|nr:hypothetical protein [Solirubrobacterales bacterium]
MSSSAALSPAVAIEEPVTLLVVAVSDDRAAID